MASQERDRTGEIRRHSWKRLDDINSTGVLLSSFAPTTDTSTSRAAALFNGFKGRPNCHDGEITSSGV